MLLSGSVAVECPDASRGMKFQSQNQGLLVLFGRSGKPFKYPADISVDFIVHDVELIVVALQAK